MWRSNFLLMKEFMIMSHLHSAKYSCKSHKNLPEDEENRIAEYRKKYFKIWENKAALTG